MGAPTIELIKVLGSRTRVGRETIFSSPVNFVFVTGDVLTTTGSSIFNFKFSHVEQTLKVGNSKVKLLMTFKNLFQKWQKIHLVDSFEAGVLVEI